MSAETLCEPPPHLRGVDGWHWVERGTDRMCIEWEREPHGGWCCNAPTPEEMTSAGWSYVAPVTPPATVAALVEALEGLMRWHPAKDTISRMGLKPEPAEAAYEAARAALAAYRGAGR